MESVPASEDDPRIQAALAELREMILHAFPDVTFTIQHGEDPDAIWLVACSDQDDPDPILDVVSDRLVDMNIDGLPVHVMPTQPLDRNQRIYREEHPGYAPHTSRGR